MEARTRGKFALIEMTSQEAAEKIGMTPIYLRFSCSVTPGGTTQGCRELHDSGLPGCLPPVAMHSVLSSSALPASYLPHRKQTPSVTQKVIFSFLQFCLRYHIILNGEPAQLSVLLINIFILLTFFYEVGNIVIVQFPFCTNV